MAEGLIREDRLIPILACHNREYDQPLLKVDRTRRYILVVKEMDFKQVLLQHYEGISTIVLNRPDLMNVLTFDMLSELKQGLEYCRNDANTKVIIITGSGRVFSAGGDIRTMVSGLNSFEALRFVEASANMIRLITSIEKPIISAVNGLAVGAGFNYVLATDHVIASENACFMQGFSKIGMIPDAGGTYLLPRIIGLHKAKEIFYTNQLIDAAHAEKMGLINRIVGHDDLMKESIKFARQLVKGPSQAFGLAKLLLNRSLDSDLDNALASEAYAQVLLMQTDDHKEGIRSFIEKREPSFGR